MKENILFMDNDPRFLDVQSRLLEQEGYTVYRALTVADAEVKLKNERIHLAILDIRVEDEDDGQDISGLLLAQNKVFQPIPKIILTGHTGSRNTYKYTRDVLGPTEAGLPPAINFIGKDEGPEVLIQAVQRALEQYVQLNWDLDIHWENTLSFHELVNFIDATIDKTQLQARSAQLEDIIRKLFHNSREITIGRLLSVEQSHIILEIYTGSKEKVEEQFIVSCGHRTFSESIDRDCKKFILEHAGIEDTEKRSSAQSVYFSATAYLLFFSSEFEEITPFHLLKQERKRATVLTEFLSTVSHELRTPLTPVQSCIQNFLHDVYGPITDKQRDRLQIALSNIHHEVRLVENLLDLVRIQEGKVLLDQQDTSLVEVIRDVTNIFEYDANQQEITLAFALPQDDLLSVRIDVDKIKQVLINLISNALKFTSKGGLVTVHAFRKENEIKVQIQDTGIGIHEKEYERVFERLYQVERSSTRRFGGMGIGLNIAKEYIEMHGGKIWVVSEIGKGSTFAFTLATTRKVENSNER